MEESFKTQLFVLPQGDRKEEPMKILFAADMSFNYIPEYPGNAQVHEDMREPAELFAKSDFSILNLENIFGVREEHEPIVKDGPNLISDPKYAEYVRALHPTVVGMANNHTLDYGESAMRYTKELLQNEGYICIGAGENLSDAYRPAILEKDGVRVAIIAVCENEFGIAIENRPGTAGYSLSRVSHAIADAKEQGCLPIIYFHSGHEGYPFPSPLRCELYRHLVELGAAAVISMHAHCPQGYETYHGAPIVYGMGNFYFPHFPMAKEENPAWFYGYMTELNVTNEGVSLAIHPYSFDDSITLLKGEELAHFEDYMRYLCAPIASEREIASWFDSWCLVPSRFGYYAKLFPILPEMANDTSAAQFTPLKNVMGCEAHNELLKNMLYMLYEGRVEAARAGVARIQALQQMQIPD